MDREYLVKQLMKIAKQNGVEIDAEVLGMIENTKLFTGVLSITSCIVLYRSTLFYEPS